MKKIAFVATLTLLVVAQSGSATAGRCGPFDIFEGNDYCVSCQSGATKVYSCPGGEVGMVAVGIAYPGCGVSYYSPSCGPGIVVLSADAKAKQNAIFNAVTAGRPSLAKEGDEVIIRMKQADFDNFMKSRQ